MPSSEFGGLDDFEWDETKNQLNIKQHGIDFEDAATVFTKPLNVKRSDQNEEIRYLAIGLLEDIEITVVYTMRGDVCRIILARRARINEREEYHQAIRQGSEKR